MADVDREAEEIGAAVRRLRRPAANTPFPREIRVRVTGHVRRRRALGESWEVLVRELGLSVDTLKHWAKVGGGEGRKGSAAQRSGAEAARPGAPGTDALVPVRITGDRDLPAAAGTLELLTPKGYRLIGLTVAEALELLRRLG